LRAGLQGRRVESDVVIEELTEEGKPDGHVWVQVVRIPAGAVPPERIGDGDGRVESIHWAVLSRELLDALEQVRTLSGLERRQVRKHLAEIIDRRRACCGRRSVAPVERVLEHSRVLDRRLVRYLHEEPPVEIHALCNR